MTRPATAIDARNETIASPEASIGAAVFRITLSVVAIILGATIVITAALRFTERSAISPWEPAIAMEAMRLVSGMPVYEPGHATHMYGPLLTGFIAAVFRVTGLDLLAARVALSVFAFALAALLSSALCRRNDRTYWLIAFLIFLGLNLRTNLVLFSAQPDAAAAFFGVGALCLWMARDRIRFGALIAIVMFVCAMLFKQTSAAFALIPIIYSLFWKRTVSGWFSATMPILSVLATLIAVYVLWPQLFGAIVTVPASIQMKYHRILPTLLYLIVTFPIFLIAVISGLFGREEVSERERWLWAGIVVLVPVSVWTMCKSGGTYNSLLPAYLAMTSLAVIKLEMIAKYVASLQPLSAVAAAVGVGFVMLFSFFVQYRHDLGLLFTRVGNEKYAAVVEYAKNLPGTVVSPEDSTIAYRARGYFGRSLLFELDTHLVGGNWPAALPAPVEQELEQAKFVVQVESYVPTPMFEQGLLSHNFHRLRISGLTDSPYTIWQKDKR